MSQIHDLNRAISAYTQRWIPIAFARSLIVFGVMFALAGVLPPLNINFVLTGLGAFLFGLLILLSFQLPYARWITIISGSITMLFAFACFVNAVLSLLPSAKIIPLIPMNNAFNHVLDIANFRYNLTPWLIARAIAALLGILLAIELGMTGYHWTRLKGADCRLLIERPKGLFTLGLAWMLSLPPGFVRYLKGAFLWLMIMMLGMSFFLLAATNIAGASMWQNFWANVQVGKCVESSSPVVDCVDRAGVVAAFSMILLGIVSLFLLPVIGSKLIRLARYHSAQNAADRLLSDRRNSILFLRSFTDDQVTLEASTFTPMRFALSPISRMRLALDYLLVEEFMNFGRPLALGSPEEKEKGKFPPFGAVRNYIERDPKGTPPEKEKWKIEIKKLATEAYKIILVFDNNIYGEDGISWELRNLIGGNPELYAKTIFIIHPDFGQRSKGETRDELLKRNRQLWEKAGELAGFDVPETSTPLLSVSCNADGVITTATTASRFSVTAVLLALREAFLRVK